MKRFIIFCMTFIFVTNVYAKDLYLDCLDFYSGNNTVKISKKFFGLGELEVFIRPTGDWQKVKILKQDDTYVFFNDGWGFDNSKKCKNPKFTSMNFCPINKEIDLLVRNAPVGKYFQVNQYVNNNCCENGKEYKAGDFYKESICLILKTP